MDVKEICGEQNEDREKTGGGPDDEGCASADGSKVEQERKGERNDDDHGKLRSDGDREGDAQQENAAPVPENDFARGVEMWATAIEVKMDPKYPQAARISGSACQTAVA